MNAEAIVDSQACRITLHVVDWIIIQTVCLCCLKPGVPVLDIHVFERRNDKGRFIYLRKGKSQAVCESTQYNYSINFVLVGSLYLFLARSKG